MFNNNNNFATVNTASKIMGENERLNSESLDQLCFKADDRIKLLEKQLATVNHKIGKLEKKLAKKPAAPAKPVGRPWNKLTKDEKHRLNAYAYRHLEECGGSWEGWEQKRLTLTFG